MRPGSRDTLWIALLTAIGAALRFPGLGHQPLWLDEATTAAFAESGLRACVLAEANHPPLYRTLLHLTLRALGASPPASPIVLRLLPALFGTLAIVAAFLVARRLLPRAALDTAALVALSPFLVAFSQEGRKYALLVLLALIATWLLLRLLDSGRGLVPYAIACAALPYTHYFGAFVLIAHELAYWRSPRRALRPRTWLASRAAIAAAFAPWAIWTASHLGNQDRSWLGPPWIRLPYALLRFLIGPGLGAADLERAQQSAMAILREEALAVLPALLFMLWMLSRGVRELLRAQDANPSARTLLAGMLLGPCAALLILGPWTWLASERYLIFQAPFVLLLVAAGLADARRERAWLLRAGCAVVCAIGLVATLGSPGELLGYRLRYAKEDWPGVARFVTEQRADAVVLAPEYLRLAFVRVHAGPIRETAALSPADRRIAVVLSRGAADPLAADPSARLVASRIFVAHPGLEARIYERPASVPRALNGPATFSVKGP